MKSNQSLNLSLPTLMAIQSVLSSMASRQARKTRTGLLTAFAAISIVLSSGVSAVELPVPCASGTCGSNGPSSWVTSGAATSVTAGSTLTVNQTTGTAVLNWSNFNISPDGHVIFAQPNTSSIALNRIFQQNPSSILGRIDANGQIYLVNPNGLIFGSSSVVNASGILASTLNISDDVFNNGLLSAVQKRLPALSSDGRTSVLDLNANPVLDANGNPIPVQLQVQTGAQLTTNQSNGRILLASQSINNAGSLTASDGQIILAAGNKLYLSSSQDPALRGLYVEVDGGGTALNDVTGHLQAARGDITMVGLAVNQQGRISASTSVAENGSVRLLARDTTNISSDSNGVSTLSATNAGTFTLGKNASIEISPELDSTATAVDEQQQLLSSVEITGHQINIEGGSSIVAAGGKLTMTAAANPNNVTVTDITSHLRIENGAKIDLSGSDSVRSVADNIVNVELRASELADDPYQRNSALRGQTVSVDARVGTGIANVEGAIAGITKTVAQRTSTGGAATFASAGDVVVSDGATIDVSGGQTTYTGANVMTSQLITADGKTVDISSARPDTTYIGVVGQSNTVKHDRWGVVEAIAGQGASRYEAGYVEGSSAGTVQFQAPALILNGDLVGKSVNGVNQRDPASATYAQGGQLIIGSAQPAPGGDYRAPAVSFTDIKPVITVPESTDLSAGSPLNLVTDYLSQGGFTRTQIYSNDTVTVPNGTALNLANGSSLSIRAGQVNINADITAPSGRLDFAAVQTADSAGTGVSVANNVKLDVSGQWINDGPLGNLEQPLEGVFRNAGSISLATATPESNLSLGSNVQMLADGGAWLDRNGKLSGGSGGSINLLASGQNSGFTLGDHINLSGYGVNGAKGGNFVLSAGRIQINNQNTWATAQTYTPGNPLSEEFLTIGAGLFSGYGFANVNLTASGGTLAAQGDALRVSNGTHINAVVSTLLPGANYLDRASGGKVDRFSAVTTLPEYQRSPAAVNLSVVPYSGNSIQTRIGTLDIEQGASLMGDPGATITLQSVGGNIDVDGELVAKGGAINLNLAPPANSLLTPYDPNLQIRVGSRGSLDTSGVSVMTPNSAGLLQGKVLDGGSITINANRGNVLIEHGAALDVSGTSAMLDVPTLDAYQRQAVASNAGAINLSGSEAIGVFGNLSARAGTGDVGTASGGKLSINLTRDNAGYRLDDASVPAADRVVELTSDLVPETTGVLNNGLTKISTAQIGAAGIDAVELKADDALALDAGSHLSLGRSLELDAPAIKISGNGAVTIGAPYVSMGYSLDKANVASTNDGTGTLGMLTVNADMIDLLGSSTLQNVSNVNLNSNGDIRLIGTVQENQLTGSLTMDSDLALSASRLYTATATGFSINNTNHEVDVQQGNASNGIPLSAGGSLTINAANINQSGTILAPFGSIALNASDSLILDDGSLTSVSGAGSLIPYGSTQQNGSKWIYAGTGTPVNVDKVPARQVTLNSDKIAISTGAKVDVSGGGDLYAYEWVPGAGGTKDALANTASNMFAIVPALGNSGISPHDAEILNGSALKPGDSVYLSGIEGLPAGFYALLPPRYALLPGAYLISQVPGYSNLVPGSTVTLPDGTPVTAGYYSFANTGLRGTSYSGFAIYPGSWGRQLAEYSDHFASGFFSESVRHTVDAGQLSIISGTQLFANGSVASAGSAGGRNASIDVAADNLKVVSGVAIPSSGQVVIDASVLNSWHPGSLLLGGIRSADGANLEVTADQVSVTDAAHIAADEVALVARQNVSISNSASIQTGSATTVAAVDLEAARTVNLTGAGAQSAAYMSVSDLSPITLQRNGTTGSTGGSVNIMTGSSLTTRGAININAPGGAQLDGALGGKGAEWSLASDKVVFADNSGNSQITVNEGVLAAMQDAKSISIISNQGIEFDKNIELGGIDSQIESITLKATALQNNAGQSVAFHANSLMLEGGATAGTLPVDDAGAGSLNLVANNIQVSQSAMSIKGFAQTNLSASGQVAVANEGGLIVNGALNVEAARISALSKSNGVLAASGDVLLSKSQNQVDSVLPSLELGGGLSISGANITDNANIVAPSAVVSLNAGQTLALGGPAVIDVSGRRVMVDGAGADSNGGVINLSAGNTLNSEAGTQLSMSGSGHANAGSLVVNAGLQANLQANMAGGTADNAQGASLVLRAGSISNFADLTNRLQTAGFTQQQNLHVSEGNLDLASGASIKAHDVSLVTDSGQITVAGNINTEANKGGGSIRLYSNQGVTLTGTGALHADGDANSQKGGSIEIGVSGGSIDLQQGSAITSEGLQAGSLLLKAPVVNGNDIAINQLNADLSKAGAVTLEASLTPYTFSSAPTTTDLNNIKSAATSFISNASGTITNRLNASGTKVYSLSPGIELQSTGDLDLNALDLSSWKFNGAPAVFAVRAAGSLNINGTVSDGFATTGTGTSRIVAASDASSASMSFVAGSDLQSADPLAVDVDSPADLKIAAGAVLRTGTGNLNLVAARDVVFAGINSGAYTGGINAITKLSGTSGATMSFLSKGGDLSVSAGRDVNGFAMQQPVTQWQSRQGSVNGSTVTLTAWGSDIRNFNWNMGTLGGGDLTVNAGRDINQLSAAAADSAKESADRKNISYYGGGALELSANRDINSGLFYAARSNADITAGREVASGEWGGYGHTSGPMLLMGDADVNVYARSGVSLSGIVNPTLMYQATRLTTSIIRSYLSSYGAGSLLDINTSAGDVELDLGPTDSTRVLLGTNANDTASSGDAFSFLPASLKVQASSGSILGNGDPFVMAPADSGQLELFAKSDIRNLNLTMSDVDDSLVPGFVVPNRGFSIDVANTGVGKSASSARHIRDVLPVSVAAGQDMSDVILSVPKSMQLHTGRDMSDVFITAQNLNADDQTNIVTGRDLIYTSAGPAVSVGGPGLVSVIAGRNIDLGVSQGIDTTGNLRNANIPNSAGADLTVVAGANPGLDLNAFVNGIVMPSTDGAADLIAFVQNKTGASGLTAEQAKVAFQGLSDAEQRAFVLKEFFIELVESGREANSDPKLGYQRAYAAIDALMPGSRSNANPHQGELNMIYSRIYTLAGGDINLLVPGGGINVGLAIAPDGIAKTPSELGIVSQKTGSIGIFADKDVLVNSSRIFTLLGGDISIWSTLGNIDAGKGAKTSLSAPPPSVLVNNKGEVTLDFSGAVAGSGIRTIQTNPNVTAGNVDLIAPAGYVNAGDAGIGAAGNINIAAKQVIGVENIQVGGSASGVPAATSGLAASLSGVSAVASGASKTSGAAAEEEHETKPEQTASLAQSALSWLEVFVVGLGEENCKQDDLDCLKRQQ